MRNGPLTGNDGKVSERPATLHRETVAKGAKGEKSHGNVMGNGQKNKLWKLKIF